MEHFQVLMLQRLDFGNVQVCYKIRVTEKSRFKQWFVVASDEDGEVIRVTRHRGKQEAIKEFDRWVKGHKRQNWIIELGTRENQKDGEIKNGKTTNLGVGHRGDGLG